MADTPNNISAVIAEIKAGNERRLRELTMTSELGHAAINRLAIESAINAAS